MSLFGSLSTAVSGLGSQSAAFNNISDNVANSTSVGFKRIDTAFEDYLTTSNATENVAGSVIATPVYQNGVQGTISQTDNPLSVAISGNGFFAVSQALGTVNNTTTFATQQYYTRAGDFSMNNQGYLVNSQGQYLNGWSINQATGVANQKVVAPIQVSQAPYQPVQTANVNLTANLPATPVSGTATASTPLASTVQVYDSVGTAHTLSLAWSQVLDSNGNVVPNNWNVSIYNGTDTSVSATPLQTAQVQFAGPLGGTGTATNPGTISEITPTGGTAQTAVLGQPATIPFQVTFPGSNAQQINLNLGPYGGTTGVTQYAGNTYSTRALTQDGAPPGNFSGVVVQNDGSVVVNYDNGQSTKISQIPVVTFAAPDALQRQNGQAFTQTLNSGTPNASMAGTNGSGSLVVESVEGSNVSIATEFAKLIGTQQAYMANSKIVTTTDQLLQATLNMKT